MANIQIYKAEHRIGEVTLLDGTTSIGRQSECQICLQHPKVSAEHAKIYKQEGTYWLEDLHSTNGTFVNGMRVKGEKYRLHHGDQIAIGEHTLRYISVGSEETSVRLTQGDVLDGEGTMMINAGQLSHMLKTHKTDDAVKRGRMIGWLEMAQHALPLSRAEVYIGKSKLSDVRLDGWFAPRISASVLHNRDGYYIKPWKRGKVSVNGNPITEAIKLNDGDRIKVRTLHMTFVLKNA